MDTHRPHDFIGKSEERSRSICYNIRESQDGSNHQQYYPQDRSILSMDGNKLCQCSEGVSDGLNCKGCHAIGSVEKPWKAKAQLNLDYRSIEIAKTSNKNPMYINPDGSGVPYWSDNISSFTADSTIANKSISTSSPLIDRRTYGKVCISDQINYKTLPQPSIQVQQQQQMRSQQAVGYCKSRYCDEKYSYQPETDRRNIKTVYTVSESAPNFLHCETVNSPSNDQLSKTTIGHRIINPTSTKMLSSSEQHQSPNYGRKCPQICSLEEQNSGYSNLYMSTPQFSSEKFATITPEKNIEYLTRSTANGEMRLRNESPKLCESPISPETTPMPTVYSHKNKFQPLQKDPMRTYLPHPQHSQQMQQQGSYSKIASTSGRPVHYITSHNMHKEHSLSNIASDIRTQSFDHYQYSGSPIALPSSDIIQTKLVQTPPSSEYNNKEEMSFDVRGIAPGNRSGLFHNPYNSSHSSSSCCNESTTVPLIVPNCRRDSSHEYQKYGKTVEEVDSSNKLTPISQYPSTETPNLPENFKSQQYCYETVHPKLSNINKHLYSNINSTPSSVPAASAGAVPASLPSHILRTSQPSHHKMHHMQYSPQYIQSYQSYPQAEDCQSQSVNTIPNTIANTNTNKTSIGCSDICENPISNPQTACFNRNNHPRLPPANATNNVMTSIVFGSASHTAIPPPIMQTPQSKKSQIPKPNYRELINQVHARRNATSEEELNMQIIKKTLNVDARPTKALSDVTKINSSLDMPSNHLTLKKKILEHEIPDLINRQVNYTNSSCRSVAETQQQNPLRDRIMSLESITKVHNNSPQLNEKASSSPLDLSMRTVKTKADSTNCKYQLLSNSSQNNCSTNTNNNTSNCSFTLPRVNFTPNFSFPTNMDPTMSVPANQPKPIDHSRSDFVNLAPAPAAVSVSGPASMTKPKMEQIHVYPRTVPNDKYFFSPTHASEAKPCITTETKTASVPYEKPLPVQQFGSLQSVQNSLIIKSTNQPKQSIRGCPEVKQVRPSVLETNPYSSLRAINTDTTTSESASATATSTPTESRRFLSINQLPPDTSIMPLIKTVKTTDLPALPHVLNKNDETVFKTSAKSEFVLRGNGCEVLEKSSYINPIGNNNMTIQGTSSTGHNNSSMLPCRKRALYEFEKSMRNKSFIKQPKLEDPPVKLENNHEAKVPVIAVNERHVDNEKSRTAEKSIQAEISCFKQMLNTEKISMSENESVLKKEPISPTHQVVPQFSPQLKSDTNSLIAARIRTKAELKGFTFIPPIQNQNHNEISLPDTMPVRIKDEPCQSPNPNPNSTTASMPELSDDYKQESLLDFSWSKTCNSLVQQLLSTPKKVNFKKRPKSSITDQSEDEFSFEFSTSSLNSKIEIDGSQNDDADCKVAVSKAVSLLENSATKPLSKAIIESRSDLQSSNFESIATISRDICVPSPSVLQKKISKMGRDKLRIQQEKRFAARLQHESSSETDNELDRRKSDRLKKPFKKAKSRQSSQTTKNRFSDCGSDSSGTDLSQLRKDQSSSTSTAIDITKIGKNITPTLKSIKQSRNNISEKKSTTTTKTTNNNNNNTDATPGKTDGGLKLKQKQKYPEEQSGSGQQNKSLHNVAVAVTERDKKPNNEKEKVTSQDNENTQQKPDVKKVQCEEREKETETETKKDKDVNKQKVSLRVGHNTITRSKRKRELELQLANSKVLRNDKIIRNPTTTTKIKRKYVRKFSNVGNQGNTNKDPFNKDIHNQLIMSTRLRSRKDRDKGKAKDGGNNSAKPKRQIDGTEGETASLKSPNQSDIFMEVYRYKRSLKIPHSLITIKHPSNHKISTALPDFENDIRTASISTPSKTVEVMQTVESTLPTVVQPAQPRSIIDVLHSRVIKSTNSNTNSTKSKPVKNNNQNIVYYENTKTKSNTNANTNNDKLFEGIFGSASTKTSSQKQDEDSNSNSNSNKLNNKKRHFSIFDTKVLQSKTRTESKMQQKREIIREIFVGDERPASAPPEVTPAAGNDIKMTYEQKYEQFLQQMNIVVNETNKFCKFANNKRTTTILDESCSGQNHNHNDTMMIKQEDDTESASAIDADEKVDGENPPGNLSTTSTGPISRRRKCGKYFRRKGSSGFDYIRKRKKPASICANSSQQHYAASKTDTKSEADYEAKEKTEDDLCREIQKWVLNKGVGQSTMHKAARLGYTDVIVYCLDRLCMNPDQKDNAGYTPLHEACTNGWLEIAKILLQYGAKHSEAAHSGIRPLHEASENDHEEIVRLLLSYGADPLLATYSGQTPLMLASSSGVRDILKNHLHDVQYIGSDRKPWRFEGPWRIFDAAECGYDVFSGAPNNNCDTSRALNRSFGSHATLNKKQSFQYDGNKAVIKKFTKVFDNINRLSSIRLYDGCGPEVLKDTTTDSEDGLFEFEEADVLLPPLYLLKDEGAEKWVLLSDLCNLLKVKSKDTLLNKIYPSSSVSPAHKGLIRELKMSDFLEKATCLQLLCAGEKINICASKVVLIKYNESVRNLLGVKKILMKF